jgi:heavy metal efflux system protein
MKGFMETLLITLIRQKLLVCLFFVLVIIAGVLSFLSIPMDAFPDLSNNQVQVITETPGMPPLETEQLVTIPLESLMNGLPRVEQVRSISKFGVSVVTVVFEDSVNTYFARQLVNERLQVARSRLPGNINPELGPITTGMGELYQYVVEGPGYSPMALKTLHDWDIKYQLRTIPGVNEINTWGGFTQEYVVKLFPEKLVQHQLRLMDVATALNMNNENFSGGIIEHQTEQFVVRGLGRINSLEDIGNIVVQRREGGVPICIRNIARVELGAALRQGAVTKDGNGEVVTGIVMMLKGENSRTVIERVKQKIETLKKSLPEGITLKPFYDQTHLVEQTVHTVEANLIEGGLLVIGVLLLLLGNVRAAVIVASTIPLSLMFSFMGMKTLGISANVMSLGALDFGMIVDGAIVMVENTLRRLSHRESSAETTIVSTIEQSVREMARPILFGVLIITVVYMPILALEGMESKLFSPMVLTVTFALLGSLLVALLLVPVLCGLFLKGTITEKENGLIAFLRPRYLHLLDVALTHRNKTVALAGGLFLLTCVSLPFLGTEFVPKLDEGDLLIEIRHLPSISLNEALEENTRIENVVKTFPEVKTIVTRAGRPDLATDPMSVYQADAFVILKPKPSWRPGITKDRLRLEISERLENTIPGVSLNFTQPVEMRVNELVSGVRADIAIKLFGDNMDTLVSLSDGIQRVMSTVKGHTDLQTEKLVGSGQLLIMPDRNQMARYGVSIRDIQAITQTAILGMPVSEVLEGKKRFLLRVKFEGSHPIAPEDVENILLETMTGQRIPLGQVAKVELGEGLEVIHREMGQRRIITQMNVQGRDIGSFVEEGKRKIAANVHLPPGYSIVWGGQFENQQRAMAKLFIVVPLSILIIFFLLIATFSNAKHAFLVLLNVPFSLIGGVLALWSRGMYLSVPACIGFIALFGVAILNGLVLVSTMNNLRAQGVPLLEAIKQAAATRLRPVILTALVATLGFLPMALSMGAGAEVQKPLATVVMGGLVTSTLLTLIVLPVLYSWLEGKTPSVKEASA